MRIMTTAGTRLLLITSLLSPCFAPAAFAQVRPNAPNPFLVEGGTTVPTGPSAPLFSDNFEYDVSRTGTAALSAFSARGYTFMKSVNSGESGAAGFLYTRQDATLESRVLAVESRPASASVPPGWSYGQTDYYLQIGQESGGEAIPANLWLQFWTYATPESQFADRDKTLYPCRGSYPCQEGQWSWLFMWGSRGFQSTSGPLANRVLALQGETADFRGAAEYPTNASKLFQNISSAPLLPSIWYQMRLHIDVSGAQGVYEAWVRQRGQTTWTKLAEWVGGVTPNFQWPIPTSQRRGFGLMRFPTTVNGPGNSTTYMDDFVFGRSQADLPP
jgi:hypothetical protein